MATRSNLAVILHADVVGSTALVHKDERVAHERIRNAFRQLAETIAAYGGVAHEVRGDALVAVFSRASDGVSATLAFQASNAEQNADLSDDIRPEIRVGIALGEVVVADNTVTGPGVVLAQRIEQLAEPGGLCISAAIHEAVPRRLPVVLKSLGDQPVKGFDEPVRVYAVSLRVGEKSPDPTPTIRADDDAENPSTPTLALPDRPSIAVLRFNNLSGDPEQEYFSDGIVEDVITALSRFHGLFVIARNSSFAYKAEAVDIKQIGRELGVRYVLMGSVRHAGSRVRITGQLVDTGTGAHIWAEHFDGKLDDVFDLQDEVTATVVGAIAPKLERAEIERSTRKPTASLGAYDYFLRGMAAMHLLKREGSDEALLHFDRAIELDPRYAAAHGMAARCYAMRKMAHWMEDGEQESIKAVRLARRAVELGPDDEVALCTAAFALNDFANEFSVADALTERALSLNPNLAWAWLFSGWIKVSLGDPESAIKRLDQAMRLSPQDPQIYSMQSAAAFAHFIAGRYVHALSIARKAMSERPHLILPICIATASAALAGKAEEAQRLLTALDELEPELSVSNLANVFSYLRPGDFETWAEGLRKAGLPD